MRVFRFNTLALFIIIACVCVSEFDHINRLFLSSFLHSTILPTILNEDLVPNEKTFLCVCVCVVGPRLCGAAAACQTNKQTNKSSSPPSLLHFFPICVLANPFHSPSSHPFCFWQVFFCLFFIFF